jgi:hypothetical protein
MLQKFRGGALKQKALSSNAADATGQIANIAPEQMGKRAVGCPTNKESRSHFSTGAASMETDRRLRSGF